MCCLRRVVRAWFADGVSSTSPHHIDLSVHILSRRTRGRFSKTSQQSQTLCPRAVSRVSVMHQSHVFMRRSNMARPFTCSRARACVTIYSRSISSRGFGRYSTEGAVATRHRGGLRSYFEAVADVAPRDAAGVFGLQRLGRSLHPHLELHRARALGGVVRAEAAGRLSSAGNAVESAVRPPRCGARLDHCTVALLHGQAPWKLVMLVWLVCSATTRSSLPNGSVVPSGCA